MSPRKKWLNRRCSCSSLQNSDSAAIFRRRSSARDHVPSDASSFAASSSSAASARARRRSAYAANFAAAAAKSLAGVFLLVSPLATILLRNRLCALPNLVLSTAKNRLTTKYGPKNTRSTKYGTAVSAPASITRYITCAQPASVAH